MKSSAILAFVATATFAQAPVAAPASAAASAPVAGGEVAPLAPLSTGLLQNHPGAPTGLDDVLLVPSASAGQKAAGFEWSNPNAGEGYVLWNKFFAAAQFTGGDSTAAQTIASFGYMSPSWGAGISFATRDTTNEDATGLKSTTTRSLTQLKVFGSLALGRDFDAYASFGRYLMADYTTLDDGSNSAHPAPRVELFLLQVGARKYPAAGVEGWAWNLYTTDGILYARTTPGQKNINGIVANLDAQVGYVLIADGYELLPGLDMYVHYLNTPASPDYSCYAGVSPYAAMIVPIAEHLTFKGGVRYAYEQSVVDTRQGDPSVFTDHQLITGLSGSVGARYEYKRGAIEAQIGNGLVGGDAGSYFASIALTANLK